MTEPDPIAAAATAGLIMLTACVLVILYDAVLYVRYGRAGTVSRGVWIYWQDHPGAVALGLCCVSAVFGGLVVHWLGW